MIRIVRATTLHQLLAEAAAASAACQDATTQAEQSAGWKTRHDEARAAYDQTFRDLGKALADRIQAERDRDEARKLREQDKAATDREMDQIRSEYQRIRVSAADPETGESVRAAIALGFLRDLYTDARANGQDTRALDLVAIMCGFADTSQPPANTASAA